MSYNQRIVVGSLLKRANALQACFGKKKKKYGEALKLFGELAESLEAIFGEEDVRKAIDARREEVRSWCQDINYAVIKNLREGVPFCEACGTEPKVPPTRVCSKCLKQR